MISRILLFSAFAGAALAADAAKAPVAPPAAATAESVLTPTTPADAFRVITDRNIFNAYRTGRRERTEAPAPRVDTLTLVGTMDYAKGLFAFFDGTAADNRKAVQVGQSVDQFKVDKIEANRVELEHAGQRFTMAVRQQLRRPEGGDWSLGTNDASGPESAPAAATADPGAGAPAAIPADVSDIVRRMMEQRQKQLKQ